VSTRAADPLTAQLARRIRAPLARLRLGCRLHLAIDGLYRAGFLVAAALLFQLVLDRWLRLTLDQRAALTSALAVLLLWITGRLLFLPLVQPLPDRLLAALVDRAHPELCGRLSTTVQLAAGPPWPGGTSPALAREVIERTCELSADLSFLAVLNHRRAARRAAEILGLFLLAVVAAGLSPKLTGTWFARNWLLQDVAWPQQTYIWPDGFDADGRRRLARGDSVEITARVRGELPDSAELHWSTPSGNEGTAAMTIVGDTYLAASIGQLSEDVHFRIVGGDERTRDFHIEAVERPRIVGTLARITPPAYTGLDEFVVEHQTVLEVLRGATLDIVAQLNKPVRLARFVGADAGDVPADVTWNGAASSPADGPPEVRLRWTEPHSGTYRFELVDNDGLSSRDPVHYTLKVAPDRPPTIRLQMPGVGELITPRAEMPVELQAADTYGLGSARLLVQPGVQAERVLPISSLTSGAHNLATTVMVPAASVGGVAPGDTLRLWAEAADLDPAGPNIAATPSTTLRVVSLDEFRMALARRELTLRQEFDRLRSAQRTLRDMLGRTLAEVPAGQAPPDAANQQLAALARTQSQQAGQCATVGRSFAQILAEMQTCGAAGPADERRIIDGVTVPLDRLARETMPAAADALTALREHAGDAARQAALAEQDAILQQMEAILGNMLEWEGYREAVRLLQETLAAQTEIHDETLKALDRQLEDILGLEEEP
jgi:hypothetical protein